MVRTCDHASLWYRASSRRARRHGTAIQSCSCRSQHWYPSSHTTSNSQSRTECLQVSKTRFYIIIFEIQESISAGCLLPACPNRTCFRVHTTRCQYQWEGPQVNKFEQVTSDCHQMSLPEGQGQGIPCLMSEGGGLGLEWRPCLMPGGLGLGVFMSHVLGPCAVRSNAS